MKIPEPTHCYPRLRVRYGASGIYCAYLIKYQGHPGVLVAMGDTIHEAISWAYAERSR
jgi:hypothetical protein